MTEETLPPDGADKGKVPPGADRNWLKLAFILSLALNLLLVGLIAGAVARGVGGRHGMAGPDAGFGPLTESLSREDRRALRERFDMMRPDFRVERQVIRADFVALAEVLRAPAWDRAAAESILSRQGARASARLEEGRKVFLDYLGTLTSEARQSLAARILAAMEGKGRDGGRDKG
jgi:uncharacterized membrane protein